MNKRDICGSIELRSQLMIVMASWCQCWYEVSVLVFGTSTVVFVVGISPSGTGSAVSESYAGFVMIWPVI
jgi:hypothetical protein